MAPIERTSITHRVAEEIGYRIRDGVWVAMLPGIRPMAAELGVSPATVAAALDILERASVIAPAVQGKRREIISSSPEIRSSHNSLSESRIAYLTSDSDFLDCEPSDHEFLEMLRHEFESRGAMVSLVSDRRAFRLQDPNKHVRELLAERPMDFWIIVAPSPQLAESFAQLNQPNLTLGSGIDGIGSAAMFSLESRVSPIIDALVAYGHQRIVLPIPEFWHRDVDRQSSAEAEFQGILGAADLPASKYNTPRFGNTSESFTTCLEKTFAHHPPTALITTCLQEHLAAVGFLHSKALRTPRDVSLAILSWKQEAEWISPKPACFKHSLSSLWKKVIPYIERAIIEPGTAPSLLEGSGEFQRGESLGPAADKFA